MITRNFYQSRSDPGFTLVEALVAVTILIIGVVGPLAVAARGIADGLFIQNQITATFLAQEALELATNQRDINDINEVSFDNLLANCQDCIVAAEEEGGALFTEISGGCQDSDDECKIVFDTSFGYFRPVGSVQPANRTGAVFDRYLTAESVLGGDGLKLTVTVKWYNRTVPKTLEVSKLIFRCVNLSPFQCNP